ncbi:MAG: response regulator [Saprospiraceae bacterium]|nr:response regulator [Saprospiraceae bacterium]
MIGFILEDDIVMSTNLERILKENYNLEIQHTNDFNTFTKIYKDDEVDFLIIDIMIDKINVLQHLNKLVTSNKPIIFITSYPNNNHIALINHFEESILLVKPFHDISILSFLKKYFKSNIDEDNTLLVSYGKSRKMKLYYSEIQYVDVVGNYSYIYTDKNKCVMKNSITKIVQSSNGELLRINKNSAVNKKYMENVNIANKTIFIQDKILIISEKYFKIPLINK